MRIKFLPALVFAVIAVLALSLPGQSNYGYQGPSVGTGPTSIDEPKNTPGTRPFFADQDPASLPTSPLSCTWINDGIGYPFPILENAMATVGDRLYSYGGVSNGGVEGRSYRFTGAGWTHIGFLPISLQYPAGVSDGTNVYILGGLTASGTPVNTLYRYEPPIDNYTALGSFSTATWNHAAVYLNGKIYKFSGTGPGNGSTNALEIYDIASNTWSAGSPYPIAVSFVSGFAQGNFLYGAGGLNSSTSDPSAKTYRYDPASNTWDDSAIADLPQTRWGAAHEYYAGMGVLAGGYVNGSATSNISTSAIAWDPA